MIDVKDKLLKELIDKSKTNASENYQIVTKNEAGDLGGSSQPTFDYDNQPYMTLTQLLPDTRFRNNKNTDYLGDGILSKAWTYPDGDEDDRMLRTGFHEVCTDFELLYSEDKAGVYKITPIDSVNKTGIRIECVKAPKINQIIDDIDSTWNEKTQQTEFTIEYRFDENGDPVYQTWVDWATMEGLDIMSVGEDVGYRESVANFGLNNFEQNWLMPIIGPAGGPYTFSVKIKQPAGKQLVCFLLSDFASIIAGIYGDMDEMSEEEMMTLFDTALIKIIPEATGDYVTVEQTVNTLRPPTIHPYVSGMELGDVIEIEYMTLAVGDTAAPPVDLSISPDDEMRAVYDKSMGLISTINVRPTEWSTMSAYAKHEFDKRYNDNLLPCISVPSELTFTEYSPDKLNKTVNIKRMPPIDGILTGSFIVFNTNIGEDVIRLVSNSSLYTENEILAESIDIPKSVGFGAAISEDKLEVYFTPDRFKLKPVQTENGTYYTFTPILADEMYIRPLINEEIMR